jgi:hypothetical protein
VLGGGTAAGRPGAAWPFETSDIELVPSEARAVLARGRTDRRGAPPCGSKATETAAVGLVGAGSEAVAPICGAGSPP